MQSFFFRIFNLLVLTALASIANAAAEANAAPPVEIVGYRNYQPMAKRDLDTNATMAAHPSKTSINSPLVWHPSSYSVVVLSSQSTPITHFSTSEDYASLTSKSKSDPTFSWPSSFSNSDIQSSFTPGIDLTISPSASTKSFYTPSSSPLVSISSSVESLFTLSPSLTASNAISTDPFPAIPSIFPTDSDFESFFSSILRSDSLTASNGVSSFVPRTSSSVPVSSGFAGPSSLSSYSFSTASSGGTSVNSFSTSSYRDAVRSSSAKDSPVLPSASVLSSENIESTLTTKLPFSVSSSFGTASSPIVIITPTHTSGDHTRSPDMSISSSITPIHGTSKSSAMPIFSSSASGKSDIESPSTSLTPSKLSSVLISSSGTSSHTTSLNPSTTPGNTNSFHHSIISSVISTTSDFEDASIVSTPSTILESNDTTTADQRSSTSASSFYSSPVTDATSSSQVGTYQVTPVVSSSGYASQTENQTVTFSSISAVSSSNVHISTTPAVSSDVATSREYPKSSPLISAPVNSTETVYTVDHLESETHQSSQSRVQSHSTGTPSFTSSSSALLSKTEDSILSGTVTTLTPSVAVPSNTSAEKTTLQHTHYSPSVTPGIITMSENSTWLPGKPVSSTQSSASTTLHSSAMVDLGTLQFNTSSTTTPVSFVTEQSTSEPTSLTLTFSSASSSYHSPFYNRTATFSSPQTTYAFTSPIKPSIQSNIPLVSESETPFATNVNTEDVNPLPSSFETTSPYASTTESSNTANLPQPTSETQAPQWLPTRIFTATEAGSTSSDSHISTRTTLASPSPTVPRVIAPPTDVPMSAGQTIITIGFKKELNFAFLFSSPYASAQILEFLPKVLSFPFNISGVHVEQIVPLESKSKDYLASVALVYFPSDKVNDLKKMIDNSTSPLYESFGGTGRQLASLIDPSIPLKGLAGKSTFHSDTNEDAGSVNAGAHNIGGLDDPQGLHKSTAGDISKKARTMIGVVVGSSCAAVVLIFLVFNYYYVKRGKRILVDDHSIHSSSSASLDNVLLGHQSYTEEKSLQHISMLGGPARASVSPTLKIDNWMDYNDNYGRASETSKPSYVNGRITTISAPIASENSLGWDA